MLITALEKNELHKYLMGEDAYKFVNPFVEEPTDIATVFISGLNQYVISNDAATLKAEIKDAMLILMNSPEGCWWTIRLIKAYLFQFFGGALKFEIPVQELLPAIQTSLNKHKMSLVNNQAFTGWRFDGGLWEQIGIDVKEINTTLTGENKITL